MGDIELVLHEKHNVIPILLKESPKPLIGAPFFGLVVARDLTQCHDALGIDLVVVDDHMVGVDFWNPHL
jgi:hypothetical protein